ncbi:MAG: hypothetical protein O2887_02285 [Bacteroidetes bacterium]|nr:hypothetical protein [Bacteroidota bacterium]MDA1119318.1 hypothetical protein [Bacteroidota bacterium]
MKSRANHLVLTMAIVISSYAYGQQEKPSREIITKGVVSVSQDRNGSIYVADKFGNLNRYSANGDLELTYSTPKRGAVTLLEAWPTLNILLFYQDFQSITLLDRFLTPIVAIDLNDKVGFVRLATFNYESNFWLIDDSDFSLKLWDRRLDQITVVTPFNLLLNPDKYAITFMREYQNQLFISDLKSGILIFDNLGNYLRTLPFKGVEYFNFFGNEIYFLSDDGLNYYNIYSFEKRLVAVKPTKFALDQKNGLVLIDENMIGIYSK